MPAQELQGFGFLPFRPWGWGGADVALLDGGGEKGGVTESLQPLCVAVAFEVVDR